MVRNPIDVATRVSPNLSALIENRINRSEPGQIVTLETMREFLTGLLSDAFTETEQLHHFDVNESLLDELNALIEEYGETAAAIDFIQKVASEPLSRVIEAAINQRSLDASTNAGVGQGGDDIGASRASRGRRRPGRRRG